LGVTPAEEFLERQSSEKRVPRVAVVPDSQTVHLNGPEVWHQTERRRHTYLYFADEEIAREVASKFRTGEDEAPELQQWNHLWFCELEASTEALLLQLNRDFDVVVN
jgi:hypothetical protein